jgi:hypothetical protein
LLLGVFPPCCRRQLAQNVPSCFSCGGHACPRTVSAQLGSATIRDR